MGRAAAVEKDDKRHLPPGSARPGADDRPSRMGLVESALDVANEARSLAFRERDTEELSDDAALRIEPALDLVEHRGLHFDVRGTSDVELWFDGVQENFGGLDGAAIHRLPYAAARRRI